MDVQPVDPRDEAWELDVPRYRVYFFASREPGATSYEYEVTGAADVHEVLAWADADPAGRTYVLYLCHADRKDGLGLLRLAGSGPNAASASD